MHVQWLLPQCGRASGSEQNRSVVGASSSFRAIARFPLEPSAATAAWALPALEARVLRLHFLSRISCISSGLGPTAHTETQMTAVIG